MDKRKFLDLYETNLNDKTKEKNKLKYLSWAYAWYELKKVYPDATYTLDMYDGKPYLYDDNLGYLVSTKVTAEGETIPMSLPVMDGANNAMKSQRYSYKVKEWINRKFTGNYIDKFVEPATMFDINTAMMRCLVKNISMFGVGLYIYANEDIPSIDNSEEIFRAVSMISQAVETNDVDYIKNNWAGSIAQNWQYLNEVQTNTLNAIFNKLNQGSN